MFSGEYEYKIDAKGRVSIPPKFRGQFADGIVLKAGIDDGCLEAYPLAAWAAGTEQYKLQSVVLNQKDRRLRRLLFSTTFSLELDEQGRIMLPPALRQHAGIKDTLVITGLGDYLEIWDKGAWKKEQEDLRENAFQIIESVENRQ
ncbi:MAG: division/cell wall cluster transcriptional repressor MraZ [Dehalococcoidia bacterium]